MRTNLILGVVLAVASAGCGTGGMEIGQETRALDGERNPVVFVHGCYPGPPLAPPPYTNEGSVNWDAFLGYFSNHGYAPSQLNVWVYDGPVCGDINDMVEDLAAFVGDVTSATGEDDIDIIAHSMGDLTARTFVQKYDDEELPNGEELEVENVVLLAGSAHGTAVAELGDTWQAQFGYPAYQGAKQMYPPYACQGVAPDDIQYNLNGCLTPSGRLVAADETPGEEAEYLAIYLTNDEINIPRHTACLNQEFIGDCSDPINVPISHVQPAPDGSAPAHVTMLFDPVVVEMSYLHLQEDEDDDEDNDDQGEDED